MNTLYFSLPAVLVIASLLAFSTFMFTRWVFVRRSAARSDGSASPSALSLSNRLKARPWLAAPLSCVLALLVITALHAVAQSIGPQAVTISGQSIGPITYGRNIQINTPQDTVHLVISGPQPTNGLTNDQLDIFTGSQLLFGVNSNGALINGGYTSSSSGIQQSQQNIGIQSHTWTSVSGTSTNHFDFNPPYPYGQPPLVFIAPQGAAPGSNWVLSVSTNEAVLTNNAGTANIIAVAIGS